MSFNKGQLKLCLIILVALLLFIPFLASLALATDAYKPYLHNPIVPEHPILGLQGIYETDLWPGAGTYSYPIDVPPGRNGVQPSISLNYNSLLTNQRPTILGTAWTLNGNYIQRDVDYSFADTSDDKFNLVLNGQSYNLVYDSSDKKYHTEIESYFYIQNISGGNNTNNKYWIIKTKEGIIYRFGYNLDSELVSNLHSYTVKWSLDLINDTHNNLIYYSYYESPYANDTGTVYPYKIEYNDGKNRVIEFILESSDRPDKWLVYEQGNKIKESRRIKEIQIKANGNLVRKYLLNYTTIDSNSRSFLSSITLYGNDGITSLPPVIFEYYNVTKGWQEDDSFVLPSDYVTFEAAGMDYGARLLDFDRDGLIDITRADELNPQNNQSWINNGSGWVRNDSWNVPDDFIVDNNQYDRGIRFIDFNGDGFTDIVRGDGAVRKSWQNSMNGWLADNSSWHLPANAHPVDRGVGIYERGVRFADINSDGLSDILSATDDWNYAWINNGSGWVQDNSWKVPSEARFVIYPSGEDEGVRLEDVNGDGLVDLIKGKGNNRKTWLNNGTSWTEDSSWAIPANAYFVMSGSGEDEGVRLADINGDGLIDILKGDAGNESTWINNGGGWTQDNSWNVPERANFVSKSGANKGVRIVDVNGDGLVDLMNGGDNQITFINKAQKIYLLKKITNNLGGSNVIDYIESTNFNNEGPDNISDLGFNLWAIDTLSENKGIDELQNISFTTYYSYIGGYYNYNKKEFRGFNHVDEIKPNISIAGHWFYQNDSFKGKEYKTEIFDYDSRPFQKIEYEWNETNKNNYHIVTLSGITDYLYDGSNDMPKITKIKYSYDGYGNVLKTSYFGDDAIQNDENYGYLEYSYNLNNWIVDKPKRYALYNYDDSTKIQETFYRYDGLDYDDPPTKGDLTWKEQWLNGGENSITKYSYDTYGNLINETDPNNQVIQYIYGLRDTTYTFIDKTINAKGHATNYNYDLRTGNLLSQIDSNGYITNYTYDSFGRIVKQILPYDNLTYPTKEYSYNLDGNAPESIKIMQREKSGNSGTLDFYYFYDGFGRLIQIKTEAEDSKQIVNDIYYDGAGRIKDQSNPYFIIANVNYSEPNSSINTISYYYDALSRVIKIKNQDSTSKNITFDHRKITQYDENGNKKIYYLDAHNQIVKVIEYLANNYFATTYSYDSIGAIIQINDSYNNIFNYSYDTLGRKIMEINADSGTWRYYYDAVGNLIKQTDNKGNNVSLKYDGLNRLTEKNSSNEIVNYTYDKINGTLWKSGSSILTINYTYDNRLRKTKETRIIDGKLFTKQWSYDAMDRIQTETLPDNSIINYNYTAQGQINEIKDVLDDVDYNSFSKPTKLSYVNNLDTIYTYNENNFRVEKIETGDKQELGYNYDSVGNVMDINDSSNNFYISMIYDKLDRLIHSKREGNSGFEFNYTYNLLGNILKILGGDNLTYYYSPNPVHAPLKITTTQETTLPDDPYKFYITNSSGINVAWFGNLGNIALRGTCSAQATCTAPSGSFIIANASDNTTAYIDNQGNLCIEKGDCSDQSSNCNPTQDAFIIQDSSGTNVSFIDFDGDLCLIGQLYENFDSIEEDTTSPVITINKPESEGINYPTSSVYFNVTLNEDGDTCLYSLNLGIANKTMTKSGSRDFTGSNLSIADGQYTVNYYCNDTAGNSAYSARGFGIDTTLPNVIITEPKNITYSITSLEINFSASDSNLDSCWYSNNSGITNASLENCNNVSYTASEGSTTIKVYANDTAGNENFNNVTFSIGTSTNTLNIAQCQELNSSNKLYLLQNNADSTGICFNITANNVTLDCSGHWINYSTAGNVGYGIYSKAYNFTTIKNCKIKEGSTTTNNKHGIYFIQSTNNLIINNTVVTKGTASYGIYLYSDPRINTTSIIGQNNVTTQGTSGEGILIFGSSNNTVDSNRVTILGSTSAFGMDFTSISSSNTIKNNVVKTVALFGYGIRLQAGSRSIIVNNSITTEGQTAYGLYLYSSSNYNLAGNNTIVTSGLDGTGIMIDASSNNTLLNNIVTTSGFGAEGIYIALGSTGNAFYDGKINASKSNDTLFYPTSYTINNFTNVTLINNKMAFYSGSYDSRVNVYWYLDALIKNATSGNPINQANVTAWNIYGTLAFSVLTGSNGKINKQILLGFWKNATKSVNYNNYTINASKTGFITQTRSVNVSTNRNEEFNLISA